MLVGREGMRLTMILSRGLMLGRRKLNSPGGDGSLWLILKVTYLPLMIVGIGTSNSIYQDLIIDAEIAT